MNNIYRVVTDKLNRFTPLSYNGCFSLGIAILHSKHKRPLRDVFNFLSKMKDIAADDSGSELKILIQLWEDTYWAWKNRSSDDPVLQRFQQVAHSYNIEPELIDAIFEGATTDLEIRIHTRASYNKLLKGSAQAVALICLKILVDGNEEAYRKMKPFAIHFGNAILKQYFLNEMADEEEKQTRIYFPNFESNSFKSEAKLAISHEIEQEFEMAYNGIKALPVISRLAVSTVFRLCQKMKHKSETLNLSGKKTFVQSLKTYSRAGVLILGSVTVISKLL